MDGKISEEELRNLPAVIDLTTAGRVLGIGRSKIYEMAKSGELQEKVRVLRFGSQYRISTADLRELLHRDGEYDES